METHRELGVLFGVFGVEYGSCPLAGYIPLDHSSLLHTVKEKPLTPHSR